MYFQVYLESVDFNDSSFSSLIEKEEYLLNFQKALNVLDQQNKISLKIKKDDKKLKDVFGLDDLPTEIQFLGITS